MVPRQRGSAPTLCPRSHSGSLRGSLGGQQGGLAGGCVVLRPPRHEQTYLQLTAKVSQCIIRGRLPASRRGSSLISLSPLEQEVTPRGTPTPRASLPQQELAEGP